LKSNYNIKYICTIYTRLDACLMSISRFSLRYKITLRLLKLYFLYSGCGRVVWGAGHKVKRLVLQCINGVSSNPVENKNLTAQRSNSNTVWFNFQTYIYILSALAAKQYRNDHQRLACLPVSKVRTNKFYILRQCTHPLTKGLESPQF
jgi:hypothetical protein